MTLEGKKTWLRKMYAGILSFSLLAGGAVGLSTAFAADDDGTEVGASGSISGGGHGGKIKGSNYEWGVWAEDTPERNGDAFQKMKNAYRWLESEPWNIDTNFIGPDPTVAACTQAVNNAIAQHGGQPSDYRRVLVGTFYGDPLSSRQADKAIYTGRPGFGMLRQAFDKAWPSIKNDLQAHASNREAYLQYVYDLAIAQLPKNGETKRFCVVLRYDEPEQNYSLNVTTQAQNIPTQAGSTQPVWDRVTISRNGGADENVNVDVQLQYYNYPFVKGVSQPVKTATKTFTMNNNTTADSPQFTPNDLDPQWSQWGSGVYAYDVKIPKQGGMSADIDTPDLEDSETWVISPLPTTKILRAEDGTSLDGKVVSANMKFIAEGHVDSRGAVKMQIIEKINSQDFYIGGKESDDLSAVYVENPRGERDNRFVITKDTTSFPGKTYIIATYEGENNSDILLPGIYKMYVPLAAKVEKNAGSTGDTYSSCIASLSGNWEDCVESEEKTVKDVDPPLESNKVWVVSSDETYLSIEDFERTNNEGVDQRTFHPGDEISAKEIDYIQANLASALDRYAIIDDWAGSAQYIDFSDVSRHRIYFNGTDVTQEFTLTTEGTTTTATAKPEFLARTKGLTDSATVQFVLTGNFKKNIDTNGEEERLTNTGHVLWNNEKKTLNEPPVFIRTPKPDKLWFVDKDGVLNYGDPNWTNNVAADNKIFLHGDKVGVIVNGKLPKNRATPLTNYQIADNWADNAQYVDFTQTDIEHVKVYINGIDRTSEFDITVKGTETIATAKDSVLKDTGKLPADIPVKLVLFGEFKQLTPETDTQGSLVKMTNSGWEKWNEADHPTNIPPVYIWNPDPDKDVLGSANNNGTQDSINGNMVFPGQWLEYQVNVDLRIPSNTAWDITNAQVEDIYDPMFDPNKSSLEFYDARTLKTIPRSAWSVEWFEKEHRFMVTFNTDWVKKNVTPGENPGWLIMRFDGKVKEAAEPGVIIKNQAFEIINNSRTPTPIPVVEIPNPEPDKDDLRCDNNNYINCVNIDGKTVVEKDNIDYRLLLDARPGKDKFAYNVHKLGMTDDYDEEYLNVDEKNIQVIVASTDDESHYPVGKNVTDKFNIQVKDGKAAIFAKTVDTLNHVTGETITGDPQQSDLFEYDTASIDPLADPAIDQNLLGKTYWIFIRGEVIKEKDGYIIKNKADQNFENTHKPTKIVSNPLKDIDPQKDVVISAEDTESLNSMEVPLNKMFDYALKSSVLPENRAYPTSVWKITDKFDPTYDRWTGVWSAYADRDIYENGNIVVKAGEKIADNENNDNMFNVTFDEDSYTMTAEAGEKLLTRVNSKTDLEAGFTFYVKMERIAPSEKIPNIYTEHHNNADRESNEVWTKTPEDPAISLVKFDVESDIVDGDRNTMDEAFMMSYVSDNNQNEDTVSEKTDDTSTNVDTNNSDSTGEEPLAPVRIGFLIENIGNVPLKDITLTDETINGSGHIENITCEEPLEGLVLRQEERIMCEADLVHVKPGDFHTDNAKVTGKSVFTDKEVSDEDPWNGKAPEKPSIDVTKWDTESGVENGDRNNESEALTITKNETPITFTIKNTGDVALKDVKLTDATTAGDGTVEDITCDKDLDGLILGVGETVECHGVLRGVSHGTLHTDEATVTAKSVNFEKEVTDSDKWNGEGSVPPTVQNTGTESDNTPLIIISVLALISGSIILGASVLRKNKKRS